ncbi:MAG: hypothetical protein IJS28_04745 [Synergistaceae bacterium]|nr:hypothetical protein [Synergistaceae bacterium]
MVHLSGEGTVITTALITALIETPLFWLAGYRNITDCLYFAGINIVSNIMLNRRLLSMRFPSSQILFWAVIILAELCVVVLEFVMCCCIMKSVYKFRLRRLLFTMLFTNASSFLLGILWILL